MLHACRCSLHQPCSEPAHTQMYRQIPTAPSPISEGMQQPLEGEGAEVVASLLKGHHALATPSGSHLLLLVLPLPPAPNSAVFKHTSKVPGSSWGALAAARFLLSVRADCSQLWHWESGNMLALLPGKGSEGGSQGLSPYFHFFCGILAAEVGQLCPPPSICGAGVVLPGITSAVRQTGPHGRWLGDSREEENQESRQICKFGVKFS